MEHFSNFGRTGVRFCASHSRPIGLVVSYDQTEFVGMTLYDAQRHEGIRCRPRTIATPATGVPANRIIAVRIAQAAPPRDNPDQRQTLAMGLGFV